ncbi:hypothetical protein BT96DRAFT_941741 [Gymnopus androsaceus JB14]|uniref:Uncharacterized protein n=1 Tax=Gymnopus androsaceus JB14 TaxID=1447944 RepID=A0A6A4HGG3_9AGAR|nr:hypothetical protein BT96DRAFT_941741 [Gymnopus androsaceus JB14]
MEAAGVAGGGVTGFAGKIGAAEVARGGVDTFAGEMGAGAFAGGQVNAFAAEKEPIGCKDVNKMVIFLFLGIYLPSSNLAFLTHEITFNMSLHTGIPPTLSTRKSQPPANMQNPPGKDSDPKSHPTMCTDAVGDAEAPPAAEMDLDADSRVSTVGRKKKKENKGGKRGNSGVFMRVHQTFLKKHAAKDLKQATRLVRVLWLTGFRKTWFNKFPWHLGQQPAKFAALNDEPTIESADREPGVSTTLSEEEHRELMKHEKLAKNRVQAAGIGMPDYKFWMLHPLYKEKFRITYEKARSLNLPAEKDRMKFQCHVAKELYKLEPVEVKQVIAIENEENRSAKSAAFKRLMSGKFMPEGADEIDKETKKLCVKNFTKFVQPLVDAIRAYTGLWITLLAGAPPNNPAMDEHHTFLIVSSGTAEGCKFHQWHPDEYMLVLTQWLHFLDATETNGKVHQ